LLPVSINQAFGGCFCSRELRHSSSARCFLLGVFSLIIGALLLGSPLTTALAVPFVFGILLLIEGVALIVFAFRVKG
jgi:uncharacterized membrane protein HdeD (DUF308 family)